MRPHRWFLPETPDLIGMLNEQVAVTLEGMEALVEWAHGYATRAETVRTCEHRADERKREIRLALTTAFTLPLDAEDIFQLSGNLDALLNGAKDAVRESEVMGFPPDEPMADMAGYLLEGVRHLSEAFAGLRSDEAGATQAADAAVKSQRRLERVYRKAMGALIEVDDLRTVMARRELYRRFARLGDNLVGVAERVWYAVVKEA